MKRVIELRETQVVEEDAFRAAFPPKNEGATLGEVCYDGAGRVIVIYVSKVVE